MKTPRPVFSIHAPAPRPTAQAACLLACALSLPFAVLALAEILLF